MDKEMAPVLHLLEDRVDRLEDKTSNIERVYAVQAVTLQSIKAEVASSSTHVSEKLDLIHSHINEKIDNLSSDISKVQETVDKHGTKITKIESEDKKKQRWFELTKKILIPTILAAGGFLAHAIKDILSK